MVANIKGATSTSTRLDIHPSSVETFDELCNRKWWFTQGPNPLPEMPRDYFDFGTTLHGIIERYMLADELGRDPKTGEEVNLYPDGWDSLVNGTAAALIKELFTLAVEQGVIVRYPTNKKPEEYIETGMERFLYEKDGIKIYILGTIDFMHPEGITDWKSTKNFKYAKSVGALKKNPQLLIYAMEFLQRKAEEGEELPETVELIHGVFSKDPANKKVKKTVARVTKEHVFSYWQSLLDTTIPAMLEVFKIKTWEQVPGPSDVSKACNAYGGCSFRGICGRRETVASYTRRVTTAIKQAEELKLRKTNNGTQMTLLESLQNKGAKPQAASQAAPARQVPPAATGMRSVNPVPPSMPKGSPMAAAPKGKPISPAAPPPAASAPAPAVERRLPTKAAQIAAQSIPKAKELEAPPTVSPPWALGACKACKGSGFNTLGNPCRICDQQQAMMSGPESNMFVISKGTKGEITWAPNPEKVSELEAAGYQFTDDEIRSFQATGEAQAQVEEEQEEEANIEVGEIQEMEEEAPTTEEVVQETLEQVDEEQEQAVAELPTAVPKRPVGRPRKAVVDVGATIVKQPFTLFLGCTSRAYKGKQIFLEEVLASVGAEIAALSAAQGVTDFHQLDVWRRRDYLATTAPEIARRLVGSVCIVRSLSNENELLVAALCAHAREVFEADGFFIKKGGG